MGIKHIFSKNTVIAVALVFLISSCASEIQIPSKANVQNVNTVSNATVNSLVYSLPVTVIRVEIEAEKVVSKVGPFYRYSKKLLNVENVVLEDNVEWRLKGVKVYTTGKPDYSKRFVVSASGSNVAQMLNLTSDGVLVGINLDELPETDNVLKTNVETVTPSPDDISFDDVPMLEKQLLKTSTAAMAEETANLIYKVRKRRFKILASDYPVLPPDGEAFEVSVRELDKYEKQLVELFTGKKETFSVTKTFDFIPDSMSVNNSVLCRFSKQKGILDPMDLAGTPVYIDVKVEKPAKLPSGYVQVEKNEILKQGLFCNTPARADVKVIDRNILLIEKEVLLGQYGQLISLPVDLMQRDDVKIKLDPATGALISITKE
ncbi:MAG: DUF4831 family protein [Chlorobi bacterium]|nr:DUF4831 family protein [Chlorobiota bacterium]